MSLLELHAYAPLIEKKKIDIKHLNGIWLFKNYNWVHKSYFKDKNTIK